MGDAITAEQLRVRRLKEERERAIGAAEQHLNQMLYNLRTLVFINERNNLQLELPREDQLLAAITQCARIRQLDRETKS